MITYKDGSKLIVRANGKMAVSRFDKFLDEEKRNPEVSSIKTIGPNEKCLCESGKKFKRCCMYK